MPWAEWSQCLSIPQNYPGFWRSIVHQKMMLDGIGHFIAFAVKILVLICVFS